MSKVLTVWALLSGDCGHSIVDAPVDHEVNVPPRQLGQRLGQLCQPELAQLGNVEWPSPQAA